MSGDHGGTVRVAIVTESFLPSLNGVTTSVLRVLDHLRACGHRAVVVCPGRAPSQYAGFPVVSVPAVPYRGFNIGVPGAALTRAIRDFQPDVIHAASPFALGAQALVVAQRENIASVAVFQTDVAGFARQHGFGLASAPVWAWLRAVHEKADLTLAPTTVVQTDLQTRGFNRVRRWGRGVDTEGFHPRYRLDPQTQALRQRLLGDAEILVGYVGRLAPEKQVERLAALTQLPGVRLVLVGDGPSRASVKRALGRRATLLGRRSGEDLSRAYASMDLFVHTGTDETFGQTLQEAMACAVPVVAPASGGPIDVVDHGVTGMLFSPHDDAAMTAAVTLLAENPGTRLRMGQAGRRTALNRTWDAVCEDLLRHYASVRAKVHA